jgi:hypothetical protein
MDTLLHKFNWRLMLIHFISFCLFMCAASELVYFHDHTYLFNVSDALIHHKQSIVNFFDAGRFSVDRLWINLSGLIGLLVAFAISLTICIKNKWFWVNALLPFLAAFFLYKFIKRVEIGYYVSRLFYHGPFWLRLGGSGCILLLAGCYLLLAPRMVNFINNGFSVRPVVQV